MGSVEVGLLGPFALRVDGADVSVAAGERALVARLALARGRSVAADRLVEDLWEDALPADPRNALQLRVSKLRKVLGDAIVRDDAGYRLAVPDEAVDATAFRVHVAARRLEAALSLWRGDPLDEFADAAWARAEAAELAEMRAVAHEDRVDERMAAGEVAALVPELVALVAAEPFRERRRAQLMRVLHRAGRTAEALEAYREFRIRMRDELGLTPSAALRALHQAILRGDDGPAAGADAPVLPPALPAPLTRLIGRDPELARVADVLGNGRLVTLVGPGGAGKTSIAVAVAASVASRYPGGTWFVPLAVTGDGAQVPRAVADAMGLSDPEARSARDLVSAWLAPRRGLLVLDNCEHVIDAAADLAHDVLGVAPGLTVLATSREPLGVPGEVQIRVPPLAPGDGVALFVERARAVDAGFRAEHRPDLVAAVVDALDGMPLAIELAAARMNSMTVEDLARRLDDRFAVLTRGPRTADARHRTLRAVVDWSYDLVSDQERALLRRLAVFRGGWTSAAAAEVHGTEEVATLDLLAALVDRSLVTVTAGRFGMLETIRAYAESRLVESGEAPDARERHARWCASLAERAEERLRGHEQAAWLAVLRAEDANMRAALTWAREGSEDTDLAFRLAGALGWYWYVGRQTEGAAELRGLFARGVSPGAGARARALQALSLAVRPAGCIVHPSDEGAAAAAESIPLFGEREPVRAALSRLLVAVQGVATPEVEAPLAAVDAARAALASHDDAWGVALADFVEMEIRLHHGSLDAALPVGRRAAAAFDAMGDAWGRSAVRLHLGHGLRLAGRPGEAEEVLVLAATISRETGLPNNVARSEVERGEAALQRGDPDVAELRLAEAERVAAQVGSDTLRALVSLGRAGVARWRGDTDAAGRYSADALACARAAGVSRTEARARLGLAAVAIDAGEPAPAEHLDAARRLARMLGDRGLEASALEQAARAAAAAGDHAGAAESVAEADALRAGQGRPRTPLEERDVRWG